MIKRFLEWLKSIYFKPAPAETQTPGVTQMTDQVVDVAAPADVTTAAPAVQPAVEVQSTAVETVVETVATVVATGALASFKAEAEAFIAFVEHGIAVLGADAEAELVALKEKYL